MKKKKIPRVQAYLRRLPPLAAFLSTAGTGTAAFAFAAILADFLVG